jgi:UDP-N-acetylmuramoylalanine--D-glutamate ligase
VFHCSNANATVVGLGATGLSLARFLHKRGAIVTVVDGDRAPAALEQLQRELPEVAFRSLDLARDGLPASDFIALSPGVPRASLALAQALASGTPVYGDIELFAREVAPEASVFAVTGSNGKTTTTALAGALARRARSDARAAGNIGIPILDALAETPTCSTWVLELSSFQLESTESLQLQSAAVINITDNHLDRYPSFFSYAASKERIFAHAKRQVLNRADPWSMSMRRAGVSASSFGGDRALSDNDFGVENTGAAQTLTHGSSPVFRTCEMGISGAHNAQNALAALALTYSLDVSSDAQRDVLRSFSGMPHRFQSIGAVDGVNIIDDSKATTVIATAAALSGNTAPTWLIAGGDGKGQAFDALGSIASKSCKAVHLIGRDAPIIACALKASGVPHRIFTTLDDATYAALDGAVAGDQVLLSPACASWDMFRNYAHRAEVFAAAARQWACSHGRTFVARGGHA